MSKKKIKKNSHVTGFSHYNTKPGTGDTFIFHFNTFAKATRGEEGCLHYELFQSHGCPTCFIIYHKWESADHWMEHLGKGHTVTFVDAIDHIVEDVEIIEALDSPQTFVR
ncbi:antibiotic biosynthesis monooxygenase [Planctomycetota bacterium]|nr:antibiotic biosynthesis monooxygenase [Planctomycetota bacterium]